MFLTILNHPHIVFATAAAAETAAAAAFDGDDDYTYAVVTDPSGTGKAIVKVYDATDGMFIANL